MQISHKFWLACKKCLVFVVISPSVFEYGLCILGVIFWLPARHSASHCLLKQALVRTSDSVCIRVLLSYVMFSLSSKAIQYVSTYKHFITYGIIYIFLFQAVVICIFLYQTFIVSQLSVADGHYLQSQNEYFKTAIRYAIQIKESPRSLINLCMSVETPLISGIWRLRFFPDCFRQFPFNLIEAVTLGSLPYIGLIPPQLRQPRCNAFPTETATVWCHPNWDSHGFMLPQLRQPRQLASIWRYSLAQFSPWCGNLTTVLFELKKLWRLFWFEGQKLI